MLAQHKMWEQKFPNTTPDEQLKCDSRHKNDMFPWQTRLCAWLANLFSPKKKLQFLAQTIAKMYHFGHSVTKKHSARDRKLQDKSEQWPSV